MSAGLVRSVILDNAVCRVLSYSLNCVLISDYDYFVLNKLTNKYVKTWRGVVYTWQGHRRTCDWLFETIQWNDVKQEGFTEGLSWQFGFDLRCADRLHVC